LKRTWRAMFPTIAYLFDLEADKACLVPTSYIWRTSL